MSLGVAEADFSQARRHFWRLSVCVKATPKLNRGLLQLGGQKTKQQPTSQNMCKLEMWANAQRDGRPAKHRWRSLFNAVKFG